MQKICYAILPLLLFACQAEETPESTPKTDTTIAVTVGEATSATQPIIINSTGLVQASSSTKYAFKIGGVIERLYVDEGDRIKKGQLLATLRLTEIEAQYRQAQLGLEKAQRDQERVAGLYQDSIATREALENTQTQLDVAQATLKQVDFNRTYAKIYASSAGYIVRKLASSGEVIGPGVAVFVANDAAGRSGWLLECTVTDREWALLQPGDAADVVLDAYPEQQLAGRVGAKAAQADPVSGGFRVEVRLDQPQRSLAAGMYGNVTITTQKQETTLTIPYDALVEANGKTGFVYVPDGKASVRKVPVTIAQILPDVVQLAGGLQPGQPIVLGNSAFLAPGASIRIQREE
ncbi:MAG: efflux RND transporter periplasmic adaptor subunit [Bacteroidota bacterium]